MKPICPVCDRPVATNKDWKKVPEGKGGLLCWGNCSPIAVDWRARALKAEAKLRELGINPSGL